jgi:hypothetical protein
VERLVQFRVPKSSLSNIGDPTILTVVAVLASVKSLSLTGQVVVRAVANPYYHQRRTPYQSMFY